MNFTDKELILFDLDGTLIDSVPDLVVAVNHMLRSLEYPEYNEDMIRTWVGNGAQMLVKRALSGDVIVDEDLDPVLFEDAFEHFMNYYGKHICVSTAAYPKVGETLRTLKKERYRLAIVTNKPYGFIAPILEALGLNGLFEFCVGGDSLPKRKPDPLPLMHVCEKLGVPVEKTIMVGDSKNDILAAQAAGMDSVGVTYGYNYGEGIDVYSPDAVIDQFSELSTLLETR
ncbi:MAG: phosphoglycolate phosphatase [Sulfurimonas sp.]